MKKTIYHGSEKMIVSPQYSLGNHSNDFGKGFYCTETADLAKEWACKNGVNGFANRYEIDMEGLAILDINGKDYTILNWLALLTKYRSYWQKKSIAEEAKDFLQRHYLIDISPYDIIVGYRADDSYFSFAQDFIMGTISLQKLSAAMRLGKLGEQIVIKSEKAFDRIKYVDHEIALAEEYYVRKRQRDLQARREYRQMKGLDNPSQEIYILDILRGQVSEDDLRI